jgi:Fe-Mn family superoxide dismutase
MGMAGSGWVWLVMDATGRLGVIGTYGAGTVLVQNRTERVDLGSLVSTPSPEYADSDGAGAGEYGGSAATTVPEPQLGSSISSSSSSSPQPPHHPPSRPTGSMPPSIGSSSSTQTKSYSTSTTSSSSTSPPPGSSASVLRSRTARAGPQTATAFWPLLNLSIHEHAWIHDYGVWGKEEYVRNFWDAVDWEAVDRSAARYKPVSLLR